MRREKLLVSNSETGPAAPRALSRMKIKCPICGTLTTWEENPHRPFCSEKCKLIDLGKWAAEEYKVKGEPVTEEEKKEDTDAGR
jgi:endogenous inhibitor of DNA gyrase (YacG/DUF329 family)